MINIRDSVIILVCYPIYVHYIIILILSHQIRSILNQSKVDHCLNRVRTGLGYGK